MKRAAAGLSALAAAFTGNVGLEGAFLVFGTVCLSVAAGFFHPAGPWFVVGVMSVLAGIALALPARRS